MRQLNREFDDLERWTRGMDRMLTAFFLRDASPSGWRPPTDVYETHDAVVVKVEIAGLQPDDFEITFDDRILSIRGTRLDPQRKLSAHCLEIQYGEFLSEVYLPGAYADDQIQAKYENGYLTIELPKRNPEPHTIAVQGEAPL